MPIVWLLERPTSVAFAKLLSSVPLLSITWMVIAGGIGATFIYLRLIRDWGPTRAGMYAFVTPIIATALGTLVLHERLGAMEVAGTVVLLSAAALVIPNRSATDRCGAQAPNAAPPA